VHVGFVVVLHVVALLRMVSYGTCC
jgi:hypothetical protein